MKRRAVAMVAACPFPSHQGTQVFIRHLVNALASFGHVVHLFTYATAEVLRGADLDASVVWHRVPAPGVTLRSGPSLARLVADAALIRRVRAVAQRQRFDILHVHNAEGLAVGTAVAPLLGVPLVYHAHSALALELPLYASATSTRQVARGVGALFDRFVVRYAKAVICFDEAQRRYHLMLGVASERAHVIPLALTMRELGEPECTASTPPDDLPGSHASRPGADSAPRTAASAVAAPVILYAGNPDPYQNLPLLRGAFALLRESHPTAHLRILSNHPLVAFGPLAGDTNVACSSFDSPTSLAAQMRGGALGVCTRTLWVGAPVKALSYLSAGLPVVACASGASQLATYPDAARLTDATPGALAAGMRAVLDSPQAFSPARARRDFDLSQQLGAYAAVYAKAIAESSYVPAKAALAERPKQRHAHHVDRGFTPSEPQAQ